MKHGSLFAGIGGFDLGFERAGIKTVWTVENDKNCNQVLATHWPDVRRYTDVRLFRAMDQFAEPVDLISGGFPCQDLSVAGRREGLAGERSGLWFEFARIVEEMAPEWVVVENVPGLLSSAGGADFARIIRTLEQFGYCVAWRVLDSQYFGVPQRRRRVFIVGHLRGTGSIEVLFEREGSEGDIAEGREEGKRVAAPVKASSPGRRGGGSWPIAEEFVVPAPITESFAKHHGRTAGNNAAVENMVVTYKRRGGYGWSEYEGPTGTLEHEGGTHQGGPERIPLLAATLNSGGNEGGFRTEPGEHLVSLISGGGKPGQGYPAIAELYPTLRGQPNQGPGRMADDSAIVGLVRRLTPTECERLQGFPDGWTEGLSDSARYRCLGNAVTVNVAEWIGRRLAMVAGGLHA